MDNREIDRLIAERVMGWNYIEYSDMGHGQHTWTGYNAPSIRKPIPSYSTDIADAWRVRAKVATWLFSQRLPFKKALQQIISDRLGIEGLIGTEEIILLVTSKDICLAALKAVGVDVKEVDAMQKD